MRCISVMLPYTIQKDVLLYAGVDKMIRSKARVTGGHLATI